MLLLVTIIVPELIVLYETSTVMTTRVSFGRLKALLYAALFFGLGVHANAAESLAQVYARLADETKQAYDASPFSQFSRDYFSRISRDPSAKPQRDEVEITSRWKIEVPIDASPITTNMAHDLAEALTKRMEVKVAITTARKGSSARGSSKTIKLIENGGGVADVPESYTIEITQRGVLIEGRDACGVRDGIVRLTDMIGLRQAPFLKTGKLIVKSRVPIRMGSVPSEGSLRDAVFLGYNAVFVPGGSLFALSDSDVFPQLKDRRDPALRAKFIDGVKEAAKYGLRTYCWIDTRQKFPKDHPIFEAYPDVRGTLTWKADGEYILCTEHPLVKQFLTNSVQRLLRDAPGLHGLVIIIGGEGFYHCYMHSFGAAKGHTACPRCEKLGAEQTVANLCNLLGGAVRSVNPSGEVVAWPYSAEYVWAADRDQAGLIRLLKPGTAILTEVEKDEYVDKPEGFKKHLWDYSIDLIGPGERAKRQIADGRAAGIPIYIKSESELAFEAPRLPFIPCHDRWLARANAIARSGASGAWMFPAFKPMYGSSVAEVEKFGMWEPAPDSEEILQKLAARIAGNAGGPKLREAWKHVSEAIPFSPELPSYYTGPYYLGPGQPMCADPSAPLPPVFMGRYLFHGEVTDAEGLKLCPTYYKSPTGNVAVFGKMYRKMEDRLRLAVECVDGAQTSVPARQKTVFASETSPIRWFYHTARTEANFYESCQLRDRILQLVKKPKRSVEENAEARKLLARWREVLEDEKQNTEQALPVMAGDMRLDFYFGGDHSFSHGVDVLNAKLKIIERELSRFLPGLAKQLDEG